MPMTPEAKIKISAGSSNWESFYCVIVAVAEYSELSAACEGIGRDATAVGIQSKSGSH